jgi:hypothetical protein
LVVNGPAPYKKTRSPWVREAIGDEIERFLKTAETQSYSIVIETLREYHGEAAANACMTVFERFAALCLALLDEAFASLDKAYPKTVSDYLRRFLSVRQAACRKFLEANANNSERA